MTKTAALALALLLPAGTALAGGPMTMDGTSTGTGPSGTATPADKAFAAASDAMMKGMDVKPSGDPDRDFVAMMLPHHQGAVDMARVEIQYGKNPMLRKLAADIIRAQAVEIAEMRSWQKKNAK